MPDGGNSCTIQIMQSRRVRISSLCLLIALCIVAATAQSDVSSETVVQTAIETAAGSSSSTYIDTVGDTSATLAPSSTDSSSNSILLPTVELSTLSDTGSSNVVDAEALITAETTAAPTTRVPLPVVRLGDTRASPIPNDAAPHFTDVEAEQVVDILRPPRELPPQIFEQLQHAYTVSEQCCPNGNLTLSVLLHHPGMEEQRRPRLQIQFLGGVVNSESQNSDEEDPARNNLPKFFSLDLRLWNGRLVSEAGGFVYPVTDQGEQVYSVTREKQLSPGKHIRIDVRARRSSGAYEVFVNGNYTMSLFMSTGDSELQAIRAIRIVTTDLPLPTFVVPSSMQLIQSTTPPPTSPPPIPVYSYTNYNLLHANTPYVLMVGVLTSVPYFDRRWAIRQGWLNYPQVANKQVIVRFFVAQVPDQAAMAQAYSENQLYQDMVFLPHNDSYTSIGLKTLAMCKYAAKINVQYLMKCDDDSFVRMPRILPELEKLSGNVYLGSLAYNEKPHRELDSKWRITEEEWAEPVFPPFAHGPGLILSRALFTRIDSEDDAGRIRVLSLEDVGMGTWIKQIDDAFNLEVQYINDERFSFCCCRYNMLSGHYINPDSQVYVFQKDITGHRAICPNPRDNIDQSSRYFW